MTEYERLRDRARRKRDKAIEKARAHYPDAVKRINELERKLGASRKAATDKLKPLTEAMPRDRLFTEVMEKVLLKSGPMRMTEMAVAIKATGYRPHAGHRLLMKCIEGSFKRNPEKFRKQEDGRWGLD